MTDTLTALLCDCEWDLIIFCSFVYFILFFCYFDKNVKFSFKVLATERERERESSLFTLWEFDNARFNFIVIFRIIIS